jgi:hypothetical protein
VAKVVTPKAKLAAQRGGGWAEGFSAGTLKVIGGLEILAALGLVLPRALNIAPAMVAVAAVGWMALMVGAAVTHVRLGQGKLAMVPLAYLGVAAFIAVGRF